jgi:predicted nicotinamide N-methyase
MLHDELTLPPAPPADQLIRLLNRYAPFQPVPLCPEIRAFTAVSLVGIWEAAEALAGTVLQAPFWAWPWAAGIALARTILDSPDIVRGRTVLDFGAGGGVSSLACAIAGADRVVANDVDSWAIAVARLAAERQGLSIETMQADLAREPERVLGFDIVLCGDLAYDRSKASAEQNALEGALRAGARVFAADAGRTYFDPGSARLIATYEIPVPVDLEGAPTRITRVYEAVAKERI